MAARFVTFLVEFSHSITVQIHSMNLPDTVNEWSPRIRIQATEHSFCDPRNVADWKSQKAAVGGQKIWYIELAQGYF